MRKTQKRRPQSFVFATKTNLQSLQKYNISKMKRELISKAT